MKWLSYIVIWLNILAAIHYMINISYIEAWAFFNVSLAWVIVLLQDKILDNKNRKDYD